VREVRLVRGCALAAELAGIGLSAAVLTAGAPLAWLPGLVIDRHGFDHACWRPFDF